jgi:predicted DNA-binding protein
MKTLTLKLPASLEARLASASRRHKVSKSAIVREALQKHFSQREADTQHSFAALAADYSGCLDGGPSDLSSNKQRLKGFGK